MSVAGGAALSQKGGVGAAMLKGGRRSSFTESGTGVSAPGSPLTTQGASMLTNGTAALSPGAQTQKYRISAKHVIINQ